MGIKWDPWQLEVFRKRAWWVKGTFARSAGLSATHGSARSPSQSAAVEVTAVQANGVSPPVRLPVCGVCHGQRGRRRSYVAPSGQATAEPASGAKRAQTENLGLTVLIGIDRRPSEGPQVTRVTCAAINQPASVTTSPTSGRMLPLVTGLPAGALKGTRANWGKHIMDGDAGLIAAAAVNPICLWCEGEFERRKGGSPQRFCNSKHRDAFHCAGRSYAEHAVLSGILTAADLRNSSPEACTLLPAQEHRSDYPAEGRTKSRSVTLGGRLYKRCSSNCRSHQMAFSTSAGSAGSIQIRYRIPEPLVMLWRR